MGTQTIEKVPADNVYKSEDIFARKTDLDERKAVVIKYAEIEKKSYENFCDVNWFSFCP